VELVVLLVAVLEEIQSQESIVEVLVVVVAAAPTNLHQA
jgi:hypothetical protein